MSTMDAISAGKLSHEAKKARAVARGIADSLTRVVDDAHSFRSPQNVLDEVEEIHSELRAIARMFTSLGATQ
jgi:hypothetical protein